MVAVADPVPLPLLLLYRMTHPEAVKLPAGAIPYGLGHLTIRPRTSRVVTIIVIG